MTRFILLLALVALASGCRQKPCDFLYTDYRYVKVGGTWELHEVPVCR